MKFLDANGLALFTKKIFSKFVSSVSGEDNKIIVTKGSGEKNENNLNEVLKLDEVSENPPDNDNTNKIPSTSWVQKFSLSNFVSSKRNGAINGSLGVQDLLMVQKKGEAQPKVAIDDGSHRVDFIIDTNGEARLLNESQELVSLYVKDLHGTADKATADKNGREIDTGYLKTDGGTLKGSLGIQDVLMVQKQTAQPKINLTDGTHSLNIILDENGDVRFIDNSGKTLNIFVKQVIQG